VGLSKALIHAAGDRVAGMQARQAP